MDIDKSTSLKDIRSKIQAFKVCYTTLLLVDEVLEDSNIEEARARLKEYMEKIVDGSSEYLKDWLKRWLKL